MSAEFPQQDVQNLPTQPNNDFGDPGCNPSPQFTTEYSQLLEQTTVMTPDVDLFGNGTTACLRLRACFRARLSTGKTKSCLSGLNRSRSSLESLAKGAVQFSRKFSVQELQDRWHSLLYDPVISAEASFRLIEFERSALTLPSKFSGAGNSKENKRLSRKRKAESVRSCYYALRKRILVAPDNGNIFENGDEPLSGDCILGDPMSNHFGLQESHLDIMHQSFPPIPTDRWHF
ncbi:hypothetical protein EZV62_006500 [Acer yangbiense]|uniref:Microspherule protein N-terminal domain-containing protein n=1 Tax=Acer yangbiense TaxID=1000413 RepID=A0A5C7I7S3_9ROSI|nr:hypothetical protein EZV62_006500 [Acer yangbiense]